VEAGVTDAWGGAWGGAWLAGSWGGDGSTPAPEVESSGGGGKSKRARRQRELQVRNNEIIMAVVAIVTSGALDQ